MSVTLTITLRDDHQIEVQGPIEDRGTCYMLLGVARDVIHEQALKQASALVKPVAALPSSMKLI